MLELIRSSPKLFPKVRGELRRALLHRFPYGLFFVIRGEVIQVVACFHGKRDPRRLNGRS